MIKDNVHFSLVMGTLGRSKEIAVFVESLLKQIDCPSWELIIVDQNPDTRVDDILRPLLLNFPDADRVKIVKIEKKGLSIARNIGIKLAKGQFIAFPDDDCIYGPQVLGFVLKQFFRYPDIDGLTLFDIDNLSMIDKLKYENATFRINDYNLFKRAISYTIFLRQSSVCHCFDERFGVGSVFGAVEETDFLFRMIGKGSNLVQMGGPVVFHPDKTADYSDIQRAYSYNIGVGAFFAKNISFKRGYLLIFFLTSWCKLLVRLLQKSLLFWSIDKRWYFAIAKGRLVGIWLYTTKKSESSLPPEWL